MGPDVVEHRFGEPAGEGVLLAGVVGREQPGQTLSEFIETVVPKFHFRQFDILELNHPPDAVKSDPSQGDEPLQVGQQVHLRFHPWQAVLDLNYFWAVLGGDAPADSGDESLVQLETVTGLVSRGLVGELCPVKRRIKEVAAGIPGEHPPGAVGTMRAGRQPDDHDLRIRIAKPWHGFAPVGFVLIGFALGPGDFFPPSDQSRAFPTGDDFSFEGV